MSSRYLPATLLTTVLFSLIANLAWNVRAAESSNAPASAVSIQKKTLDQCIAEALQNNRRRPASRFAIAMAEAQHRQALAAYWPQITLRAAVERMDERPNFVFPSRAIPVPPQNITIPFGGSLPITIPGIGTIPLSTFQIPEQTITVPAQEVILQDRDSAYGSLGATWLLYDGGMRKGYREQGKGLVDLRKEEARRTDLEIADGVKRFYYGSVLAAQVHQVGQDTLARMEATLNLTETMYKEGSGRVKKTDWLENKVMVESLRSMVALLEKNEAMAQAALANTVGLPWNAAVKPADKEMPYAPYAENLDSLVSTAYQFSPDWNRLEAGLRAAEGAARTAKSGHSPKMALTGGLHKWWNDADGGMATVVNREGWTVGVGLEIPLFDGFLTRNRVAEARAQVSKLKEEKILLKEGIALQIKDAFLSLSTAQKAHAATLEAMKAAIENRDLNTRAYQNDLVDTEKVIRAQLMEALMSATHYKARYDHIALQSQITLLVGTEVINRIEGTR
ncbi:MAG: TolC family protein [Verrucomicrobia bacterium]|nr:TolC family protein [Verrucomicrobiota bacterium]